MCQSEVPLAVGVQSRDPFYGKAGYLPRIGLDFAWSVKSLPDTETINGCFGLAFSSQHAFIGDTHGMDQIRIDLIDQCQKAARQLCLV